MDRRTYNGEGMPRFTPVGERSPAPVGQAVHGLDGIMAGNLELVGQAGVQRLDDDVI